MCQFSKIKPGKYDIIWVLDKVQAWKRNTSQNRGQLISWWIIQLKEYPKYLSDYKLDNSQVLTNFNEKGNFKYYQNSVIYLLKQV